MGRTYTGARPQAWYLTARFPSCAVQTHWTHLDTLQNQSRLLRQKAETTNRHQASVHAPPAEQLKTKADASAAAVLS